MPKAQSCCPIALPVFAPVLSRQLPFIREANLAHCTVGDVLQCLCTRSWTSSIYCRQIRSRISFFITSYKPILWLIGRNFSISDFGTKMSVIRTTVLLQSFGITSWSMVARNKRFPSGIWWWLDECPVTKPEKVRPTVQYSLLSKQQISERLQWDLHY